ncbi:MAG TPA: polysaccharide deacetylase family protein [Syntrophales bacterium]|nr:polysaccharide deacetylase family protein [Syntrophales bacterium]HOX95265.1 polysaccharide deacetylase family protein [Syntrophales bacterium]HPI57920.1 polysaccharide deacetylase family protein [Syntrophales bacterium]HPN24601.1 polysaccharide deacetylase family protein [Syntrophales bacterium]HQM28907.1 polysaccharide deacetylase family protein [Syntrophales bacterium]
MARYTYYTLILLLALLPGPVDSERRAFAVTEKTIQDAPPASPSAQDPERQPSVRKKIHSPRHLEMSFATLRESILVTFTGKVPRQWGENVIGTKTAIDTDKKFIALTFDACGGSRGRGYDAKLINFLKREKIPATLFLSGKWIDANPDIARELAEYPLFEIANHGLNHRPCSINGKKAQGIQGTRNIDELIDEIEQNARKIEILAGKKPKYFRPAAGFCDEYGVKIASALGYEAIGWSLVGDAGATYSKKDVIEALLGASPGAIVILHMNAPQGETAEGLMAAIPELRNKGFEFVRLGGQILK